MKRVNQSKAWLYLLPAILLLIFFTVIPFIKIIGFSFMQDYSISTNTYSGIGFSNFADLFNSTGFVEALGTTAIAIVVSIPVSLFVALAMAIALNNIKVLNRLFRTVFFVPFVTNALILGYVTMIIYVNNNVSVSLFNWFLGLFGVESVNWLTGAYFYKLVVYILYIIWRLLPFEIIILISALHSIKKEYYVSAKIDGCSPVKQFNKITLPMLVPMLSFLTFSGVITVLKDFDNAIGIFGGESLTSANLTTLTGYMYSGMDFYTGKSSAVALIISVIFIVLFMVVLFMIKRRKDA
ncbi:MAG: sugar ABC transporter permease [Acholeplasmatales bacterium]|nr:sugar ABC transporter permease [Acholeplasmatales bacterium]